MIYYIKKFEFGQKINGTGLPFVPLQPMTQRPEEIRLPKTLGR